MLRYVPDLNVLFGWENNLICPDRLRNLDRVDGRKMKVKPDRSPNQIGASFTAAVIISRSLALYVYAMKELIGGWNRLRRSVQWHCIMQAMEAVETFLT
jgi:hypothetical protein